MPEIAEVARACHYLRQHLKNRKIATVDALEDAKLFATAKTGLTSAKLKSSLVGRTVKDAKQQGKYFWLEFDKPPHLLCHFGMTGWFKFSNDESAYYKPQKERIQEEKRAAAKSDGDDIGDEDNEKQDWPPRFWKLLLKAEGEPQVEAAFIDARRFGKIMLIDAPADQMRYMTPLKENGPDPVQDSDKVTVEWLKEILMRKRVPIKALLLDQAILSGIGNWVADEVLYQARIHPEQYCNTFSDAQIDRLHTNLMLVCTTACNALADSSKFPADWLMRHRWGKGKQDGDRLPNGDKIKHITVGGRTSAIVPSLQKKTGPVAGGASGSQEPDAGEEEAPAKSEDLPDRTDRTKRQRGNTSEAPTRKAAAGDTKSSVKKRKAADTQQEDHDQPQPPAASRRRSGRHAVNPEGVAKTEGTVEDIARSRRRSGKAR